MSLKSIAKKILVNPEKDKQNARFIYKKNVDESLKMLQATTEALDAYGIPYYLDFGTLIGAMRDGAFIPWDDDVDISLLNHEDAPKAVKALRILKQKDKLKIQRVSFARSIYNRLKAARKNKELEVPTKEISFADPTDLRVLKVKNYRKILHKRYTGINNIDIFIKYPKDGKLYWMAQHKVHSIDASLLDGGLIEIDFYHLKCKIPKNYDEYLTAIYGDWKTPKEDWQYYEQDD